MPNIGAILREEITRLARREVRGETAQLKKTSSQYRTDIAALKRQVDQLEKQVSRLQKTAAKEIQTLAATEPVGRARFSAKSLSAQRQRLGLSAPNLGILLGVSAQSIYNWESEKTRPGPEQIAAIAALRKLGKKEANNKLGELAA